MHKNNFGFLRLLLAILVIISHSPELIDGDRNREYLHMIFGTMSLGDFAVDCFFIISGYLITMSYENSTSLKSYMIKRVLRIYPAFILASIFCFLVIIPLSSNISLLMNFDVLFWVKNIVRVLFLELPWTLEGVFENVPIPFLNGPVWTIQYEFLCYLLIPVILILTKADIIKYSILITSTIILSYFLLVENIEFRTNTVILNFSSRAILRLVPAFLIGSVFFQFRDKIVFKKSYLFVTSLLLSGMMFNEIFAHIGLITFGAYILFYFALNYKNKFFNAIGSKVDLSYGLYLYAWPIQNLLVQFSPKISPFILTILTLIIATFLATISWFGIEKPFMKLKKIVQ